MKNKKILWLLNRDPFWIILALVLFLFFTKVSFLSITDSIVTDSLEQVVKTKSTFAIQSPQTQGDYTIKGKINFSWYSQHVINLQVDDCLKSITVNGQIVDLSTFNPKTLCKNDIGLNINLSQYLKHGGNLIEFKVHDYGGYFGLYFKPNLSDLLFSYLIFGILLFLFLLVYPILKKAGLSRTVVIILFIGVVLRIWYLNYTPFDARSYDVEGHIDYINYLLVNHRLPQAHDCWECFQQPFYYVLSAGLIKILNISQFVVPMQWLSMVYWFATTVLSILLLKQFFKNAHVLNYLVLLLVNWPALIINSVKIGNDGLSNLFLVCILLTFFFWLKLGKFRFFLLTLIFYTFAIFTKAANYPIAVLIITGIVLNKKIFVNLFSFKKILLIISVLFVTALSFSSYYLHLDKESVGDGIMARMTKANDLNGALAVGNQAVNYLYFDSQTYLTKPYISPWDDASGRQYFWNYLLKSSLFGEFTFDTQLNRNLAVLINSIAIVIFCYSVFSIFFLEKKDLDKYGFFGLHSLLMLGSVAFYRFQFPMACNNDFRLIQTAIIPLVYFYGYILQKAVNRNLIGLIYFGKITIILFVVAVNLFYIGYPFYR